MNPKITITIPTLNRSKYLKKAIESVLKQSYVDFKLVVLDNASTDETEIVVKSFKDKRLFYSKSLIQLSFSESINRSFIYCEGEYLMIFHDDDILDVNFLEDNLKVIQDDSTISLLASSMYIIDENGNRLNDEQVLEQDLIFRKHEYWKAYYLDNVFLPMPTVIFRTKYLKENNFHFSDYVGPNIDQFMWFEMNCLECKFLLRKKQLYYYRRHSGQATNWLLQSILLDRKAYWLAKKNNINEVINKIDSYKINQLNYLFKYCVENNNSLIRELYNEGYWDSLNLSIKSYFKIHFLRYKLAYKAFNFLYKKNKK